MPIYEYRCEECEQVFEEWQTNFEEREVPCPVCGGSSKRLISNTSFVLKGSGWYVTDFRDGGSATANSTGASAAGDGSSGKSADAGTAAKKEAPSAGSAPASAAS